MADDNDHLFDEEGMKSESEIALEALATSVVQMYRAFKKEGLSPQESAALTAAFVSQNMPIDMQGPQDGS